MVFGIAFMFIGNSVNAWGGIYNNRFSPEMLQNMGYGAAPHRIYQEVGRRVQIIFFFVQNSIQLTMINFYVQQTQIRLQMNQTICVGF